METLQILRAVQMGRDLGLMTRPAAKQKRMWQHAPTSKNLSMDLLTESLEVRKHSQPPSTTDTKEHSFDSISLSQRK